MFSLICRRTLVFIATILVIQQTGAESHKDIQKIQAETPCPTDDECLGQLRYPHDTNEVMCKCGACIEPLIEKRSICTLTTRSQGKPDSELQQDLRRLLKTELAQESIETRSEINKEVLPDEKYIENISKQHSSHQKITNNEESDGGNTDEKKTDKNTITTKSPLTTKEHEEHPTPNHLIAEKHKPASSHGKGATGLGSAYFLVIVIGCSAAGLVGIVVAAGCWYKIHKSAKESSDLDYPAYGVTGPNKTRSISPGDRKLAESAQMYHYQHQKQQMIAEERASSEKNEGETDGDTDEGNEEDHLTVYECPGLYDWSSGEIEVKNPLFNEDLTLTPEERSSKD